LNPLGESETKELKDAVRRTATLGATLAKAVARGGSFGDAIRKQISANEDADVDWVDLLRDFLKSTYPDDNSWSRLNPRHAWRGINLPSKVRSNKGGELLIAIDTSGSLSRTELKLFASEIEALCLDTGIDVIKVTYCDDTCHPLADGEWWDVFNVSEGEEVNLRFLGGGGTNFTPPFLLYDDYPEEVEDAVAFIYFTDGYGEVEKYVNEGDVSDRNIEPNIPVLWALTHRDDYYNDKLPFGEKIYLTFNNY
jgi:predicted metal-dependent peptidase